VGWLAGLLDRKPARLVSVALANKTARIVWAVMMRWDGYQAKQILGQPG
jgi:transposase